MTRNSLQNITSEQSENKNVRGLFRADSRPIQGIGFMGNSFSQYFRKTFCPSK